MSYQPKPVDTSHIDLGQLGSLSEYLAEQAHEVWAEQRIKEGWTYGPARDDKLKQTPDLVPYKDLPDSERDYDRNMSSKTLKLILDRSYQLRPPDERVPVLLGEGPDNPDKDDMKDELELAWLDARLKKGETFLQPLIDRLKWFGKELRESFEEADADARDQQHKYLHASFWCMVCAAAAVFLAIGQLTFSTENPFLPVTELLLVCVAVGLVLLDFQRGWRDSWLAKRTRAERLRSLKFRTLLDPAIWSAVTRIEAEAKVRSEVRKINLISADGLEGCLHDAELDPRVPDMLTGNANLDHAIGTYYVRRRLVTQAEYVEKKQEKYHQANNATKLFGTMLFFAVLLFVFAHDVLDLVDLLSHPQPADAELHKMIGKILVALAAILPAASAALHVYRAGREDGRNHLRTVATLKRLNALREKLDGCQSRKEQIRLMVQSEIAFSSEHEQWLHLMKECDWYG